MQLLRIDPSNPEPLLIDRAVEILRNDGVIAYPTETIYGLGTNALSPAAVDRVFDLKERDRTKAILIIVPDIEQVRALVSVFPEAAARLADAFWPGPMTLILPAAPQFCGSVISPEGRIGIRIPDNRICLALLQKSGFPLTSTSANISGAENPMTIRDVIHQFGDRLDLYVDGGPSRSNIPSTVLDLTTTFPEFIRIGQIPREEIERVIGEIKHARP